MLESSILDYVRASPGATYRELATSLDASVRSVRRCAAGLRRTSLLRTRERHGRTELSPWSPATWNPADDDTAVHACDMFCGAGGFSAGLAKALLERGHVLERDVDLVGINHDAAAIASHQANHPWARHVTQDIETAQPRRLFPGGHLHLLLAAPSCVHFSTARGGAPVHDQMRTHAWQVVRWARDLHIDAVLVENVREFMDWGPVKHGRPVRDGSIFRAWIRELRLLGYAVDWRILNAADHGDATSRKRFFLIARRDGRPIAWPEPTHSQHGRRGTRPWRGAAEIIDWSLEGTSVFIRKKPLATRTLRRIAEGLRRHCGIELEDFLLEHASRRGNRVLPLLVPTSAPQAFVLGQQSGGAARSAQQPLPTVASGGAIALVKPFLLPPNGVMGGERCNRPRGMEEPMQTIVAARGGGHLVEPRLAPQPFLVPNFGERTDQRPRTHDLEAPLPAPTGHGAGCLVRPCIVEYYGNGSSRSVEEPLATATTRDRFALVEPSAKPGREGWLLDIRYRMVQPTELAHAMGFRDYVFHGTKTQIIKQIGNAVAVGMANALCKSLLEDAVCLESFAPGRPRAARRRR